MRVDVSGCLSEAWACLRGFGIRTRGGMSKPNTSIGWPSMLDE